MVIEVEPVEVGAGWESVRLIAVTGPSGAGKTTLAAAMADALDGRMISLDAFLLPKADRPGSSTIEKYRIDEFENVLEVLLSGRSATFRPFNLQTRLLDAPMTVRPAPVIVAEGIVLFWSTKVRSQAVLRVFVESATEIRESRQITRLEVEEQYLSEPRGLTVKSIRMKKYVEDPVVMCQKAFCDYLVWTL